MSWLAARVATATARRNKIADLVADGMSIKDAGSAVGLSERAAGDAWARIKRDLGPQAC